MAVPSSRRPGEFLTPTAPIINRLLMKPSQACLLQSWLEGNSVTRQTTATSSSTCSAFARRKAAEISGKGETHEEEMELFLKRVQEDPKEFEHLIEKLRSVMTARLSGFRVPSKLAL
ncbi:hypothetical protein AK812_SmicGene10382 [Symbiodinium microadriaticum]|uniref:Uncharacterized protein n=1 Tax=Symbiodinium microadriaticum TaxID=2951 RepID=A0A1Q9EFX5_SYMMI|nr:hypothetical protein AK812_SmicGene10382 [Symbiodinium microadriaticum]